MKNIFRLLSLTAFAAVLFTSCKKDDPATEPTPTPDVVNEYRFDDVKTSIRSLVVDHLVNKDMYTILLSPDANLTTYEQMTLKENNAYVHPFFLLTVPAKDVASVKIDPMNPGTTVFLFENHTQVATALKSVAPGKTADIKAGSISVTNTGGTLTVLFSFTLSDDRVLDAHYSGKYTLPTDPGAPTYTSYYKYNNVVTEFKSMIVDDAMTQGLAYILMSPDEGLTTFEEFTVQTDKGMYIHEFCIFTLETKDIADLNVDAMNAGKTYSFINQMSVATEMSQVGDQMTFPISAGSIKSKIVAGKLTLDVSFTAAEGGKELVLHGECTYEPPLAPTSNYTILDGVTRSVQSAFYKKDSYGLTLYLTPSAITKPDNLELVDTYYVSIYADDYAVDGKKYDITKMEDEFEISLVIPKSGEVFIAQNHELAGAEGVFSITKKADGEYSIEFDLLIGGHKVAGMYEGSFMSMEKPNGYSLDNEALVSLQSVVVDRRGDDLDIRKVYLSEQPGITTVEGMLAANPIILEAAPYLFDGSLYGFSSQPSTSITFDGVIYSGAKNHAGNMTIAISSKMITMTFMLYKFEEGDIALDGFYKGSYTNITNF